MGIPQHYSRQIPERCIDLIKTLYEVTKQNQSSKAKHGGALSTTLLLALATPAIVIPLERMGQNGKGEDSYNGERDLDPDLTEQFDVMMKKNLGDTCFQTDWRFVRGYSFFRLNERMDEELVKQLNGGASADTAEAMQLGEFTRCLRNALSHGGIMYLDQDGRSSDSEATQLAFISGKRGKAHKLCSDGKSKCSHSAPNIESLNVLRVSESGFHDFLYEWAAWLSKSGITENL